VVITLLGMGLLTFGAWRKSEEVKKAALAVMTLVALVAMPLYFSGEPAVDSIKGVPDIADRILDQHQAAAATALASSILLGVIAISGLAFFRGTKPVAHWFTALAVATALVAAASLAWTANLGGQVHHGEIRASETQAN
jgi:hypothetical protein